MAGFKTHITTSTVLGVAYGTTAAVAYDVPLPACVLAARPVQRLGHAARLG